MAEKKRFLALDVFRGMTVCFMIIVNSPGDWSTAYSPLLHAGWHGFTPTDLVFPSFLFAVGNAMAFVMGKFEAGGHGFFWKKVLKRTFLIFLIGYLLSWFPFFDTGWNFIPIEETRIMGVLQRIALCYFFAAVIVYYGNKKFALWASGFILLSYWLIVWFFGDAANPYSLAGFIGNDIDHLLFGAPHLYGGEGVPFDPEGLLSTYPAIVNVLGGYLAGVFIRSKGNSFETIAKLMLVGALLVLGGLWWDLFFPINKKIWTSSYVLLTIGIAMMMIASLIYIVELANRKKWTYFFVVFGKNPLFIYVFSGVFVNILYLVVIDGSTLRELLYTGIKTFSSGPHASFLFAFTIMMISWLTGYLLDKKGIYIKI